jgi:hypothetical protein
MNAISGCLAFAVALALSTAAAGASPPQQRTLCVSGDVMREITVWTGDASSPECHVGYTKNGVTSELWSAHRQASFCTQHAEQLEHKLSGAGFTCMAVDPVGRAQAVLPGGVLLRSAQKEDLPMARQLCPTARWEHSVLTCSRSGWAAWARAAERSEIPRPRLKAFEAFLSSEGFVEKPANGVLIFPDLSSHLIVDGFNKRSGDTAEWLVDPQKRTVDLIWVTGGATVYAGPHAEFLRSNALGPDSFKLQSDPSPAG